MFKKNFGPYRSIVHLCIYAFFAFLFVYIVDISTSPINVVDLETEPQKYSIFTPFIPPEIEGNARVISEGVTAIRLDFTDSAGFGTGFVVKNGVVATAAHVVEGSDSARISVYCNEREVPATVIISMPERDVALLSADCTGPPLIYYLGKPDVDMMLIISGYDFDTRLMSVGFVTSVMQFHMQASPIPTARLTTDGIPDDEEDISAKELVRRMEDADSPPLLAITGSIDRGNSGSPVFTRDGVIIGMVVIFDSGHNRTFIVPAESIFFVMLIAGVF